MASKADHEARTRRLYRYITEAIRKVDEATSKSKTVLELFSASLEIHRQKVRENCEKLIFANPLLYGRKAQDLLWRKGYYETVSAAKRLRGASDRYDDLILSHVNLGIGHYHQLISKIQIEIDSENDSMTDWGKSSIQTCLLYLGDLCRYKTEFEESGDCSMSVRYYLQAASTDPKNGMPYNQLGTLFTSRNHYLDSVRYYLLCLTSENPFDSAQINLNRILDRNTKYLELVAQNEAVGQQESIKSFVCKFLAVVECCYFDKNFSNFNDFCTAALYELKQCLTFRPKVTSDLSLSYEQHNKLTQKREMNPDHLSPKMLHRIVFITLLCLNKFKKEGSAKLMVVKAFSLALLSQLLQRLLDDLTDIGFEVQSPKEIIEERREKVKDCKDAEIENKAEKESVIIVENEIEEKNDIAEEENGRVEENNGRVDEDNVSKSKTKKSIHKVRRRRKRQNSSDDSADEDSTDSTEGKSEDDDEESEDVSEASCFTYTSSDEEAEDKECDEKRDEFIENENNFLSSKNDSPVDKKAFNEELFDKFIRNDNLLIAINMMLIWLRGESNFLVSCKTTGHSLFQTIVDILNIVNRQIFPRLLKSDYDIRRQYHRSLYNFHQTLLKIKVKYKPIPLPEDYDIRPFDLTNEGLRNIKWEANEHQFDCVVQTESNAVRLLRMIDFGVFIVRLDFGIMFNRRLKMYTFKRNKIMNNKRNHMIGKKFHKDSKFTRPKIVKSIENVKPETQSEGLMRSLGKLWLNAQVKELESEVRAGRNQRVFPAYIVVDAEALSKYIYLVKKLVSSKKFIVLVPTIVLQVMDKMKKESEGARSAIRWLESQLRIGSCYLRTQQSSESAPLAAEIMPKKINKEIANFIQVIEFCNHFILQEKNESQNINGSESSVNENNSSGNDNNSSGNDNNSSVNENNSSISDNNTSINESNSFLKDNNSSVKENNSNILMLLTGTKQWDDNLEEFSYTSLASRAGVAFEHIQEFCIKLNVVSFKGFKNR